MNPAQLLAQFDRIAEAPEAVPRLRGFIHDLAVRGKLLPQDLEDNSVADLLTAILKGRERIVQGLGRRRQTEPAQLDGLEFPYKVPSSWVWSRIEDCFVVTGGIQKTPKRTPQKNTFPYVGVGNVYRRRLDLSEIKEFELTHGELERWRLEANDLLIVEGNGSASEVGRCARWAGEISDCVHQNHIIRCRPDAPGVSRFVELYLNSQIGIAGMRQLAVTTAGLYNLSVGKIRKIQFPLPPLAEQHRIVAKVDELMALCDELEAAQAKREQRRDRLVAATLHGLNNGDAVEESARFAFQHLPRLTTRPEHIQQLREAILNLAVRGQLVEQDPSDEPACELLKRIQAEKRRINKGQIKPQFRLPGTDQRPAPFRLPPSWCWVCFGELITDADAGWSPRSESFSRSGDNWGVLKVSAVSWDKFLPEENKQLLPGVVPSTTTHVHAGDFLISRANTSQLVAKCVVVDKEPCNLILSDKIVRLQISDWCSKRFLCMINNHAEYARAYYAEEASGTSLSMKNVSRPVICALAVPLPPLAEQNRIVAKVDQLMVLCDGLEAHLTTAAETSRRLLEAVLHEALG